MLLETCALEYGKVAFVWRNTYLSVQLLTQSHPCLQQGERQSIFNSQQTETQHSRSLQHKAALMKEELWQDNSFILMLYRLQRQLRHRMQRCSSLNLQPLHEVNHVVRLLCIGVISSPPNLHCCWPCQQQWRAPQVLQLPKTGCPCMGTTRRSLQHSIKTRSHLAPMTWSQMHSPCDPMLSHRSANSTASCLLSRSFRKGASFFTSPTRAPNH